MILDEFETLKILGNKYVYTVPNVSVFGELYNLVNLEPFDQELIEEFRENNLFPQIGLKAIVDNVISKKSAEFFTKIVRDGKFYVPDRLTYDELLQSIEETIELLKETDEAIFQEMVSRNGEIPTNYKDTEFIPAVNDDISAITVFDSADFQNLED
jgi:hypothetical protein